jgi:hypothetical protein
VELCVKDKMANYVMLMLGLRTLNMDAWTAMGTEAFYFKKLFSSTTTGFADEGVAGTSYNEHLRDAFERAGLGDISGTHWFRHSSSNDGCLLGLSDDQVQNLGNWNTGNKHAKNSNQFSAAMKGVYLKFKVPQAEIHKLNGHPEGVLFILREHVGPPLGMTWLSFIGHHISIDLAQASKNVGDKVHILSAYTGSKRVCLKR